MTILTLLSAFAPISVTLVLVVLGELSRRLGAVLKTKPVYRWFYVAAALTFASIIVRLLSIGLSTEDFESGNSPLALVYTLSLTAGTLLGAAVAWRYWGWLVYGSDGKILVSNRRHKSL